MSEDEFWRMTPRAFVGALEHARELEAARERAAFLRAGRVAAAVYAAGRIKLPGGVPIEAEHVFPGAGLERGPVVQSTEEMLRAARQWQAVLSAQSNREM